jgi:hypothetical protein
MKNGRAVSGGLRMAIRNDHDPVRGVTLGHRGRAFWVDQVGDGVRMTISVPDVARIMPPADPEGFGDFLIEGAKRKGLFFSPSQVDKLRLSPGRTRPVLVADVLLDGDGVVRSKDLFRSELAPAAHFPLTAPPIPARAKGELAEQREMFELAHDVVEARRDHLLARGDLDLVVRTAADDLARLTDPRVRDVGRTFGLDREVNSLLDMTFTDVLRDQRALFRNYGDAARLGITDQHAPASIYEWLVIGLRKDPRGVMDLLSDRHWQAQRNGLGSRTSVSNVAQPDAFFNVLLAGSLDSPGPSLRGLRLLPIVHAMNIQSRSSALEQVTRMLAAGGSQELEEVWKLRKQLAATARSHPIVQGCRVDRPAAAVGPKLDARDVEPEESSLRASGTEQLSSGSADLTRGKPLRHHFEIDPLTIL